MAALSRGRIAGVANRFPGVEKALAASLAAIAFALALMCIAPCISEASTVRGAINDRISWEYSDGTLSFIGNGAIPKSYGNLWETTEFDTDNVRTIVFGEGITAIPDGYVPGSNKATQVRLPDSLKTIGAEAFSSCTRIAKVTGGANVESIGKGAFSSCMALEEAPSFGKLRTIGSSAFCNCYKLKKMTFPSTLRSIGEAAFNKTALSDVRLNQGLQTIGAGAFYTCRSLTSISIPDTVTSIGFGAFANCDSLKSAALPKGLTAIDGLFGDCSSLESVAIPSSVTKIGNSAFQNCSSLKSIAIPEKVTEISEYAFEGCSSLKAIKLLASVKKFGERAFWKLPEGSVVEASTKAQFEVVASNPAYITRSRTEVRWKDGKTTWPVELTADSAEVTLNHAIFTYNGSKKKPTPTVVVKGRKLAKGENYSVAYEDAVDSGTAYVIVKGKAPWYRGAVKTSFVILPYNAGMQAVYGHGAFISKNLVYCITDEDDFEVEVACPAKRNLSRVVIPAAVKKGGVKYRVTSIGDKAFYRNGKVKELVVGNNVESIESNAFYGCTRLASVKLGKSVELLEPSAFRKCTKLTSITLPKSFDELGEKCFYGCKRLKLITIKADSVVDVEEDAIEGISKTATVKVPKRFLGKYRKEFGSDSGFSKRMRLRAY